jgi:hypothetical protein
MCDMGRAGLPEGRRGVIAVRGISGNGGKDVILSRLTRLDPELDKAYVEWRFLRTLGWWTAPEMGFESAEKWRESTEGARVGRPEYRGF